MKSTSLQTWAGAASLQCLPSDSPPDLDRTVARQPACFMARSMLKNRDALKRAFSKSRVRDAARHNLREIQAERGADSHIDVSRSGENEILRGPRTAKEVEAIFNQKMEAAGYDPKKFRVDGVRAIEIVCSLPANFIVDARAFFSDCTVWAGGRYGGDANVISAVIHNDESQRHCHILLIPLRDGKMKGSVMGSYRKVILASDQKDFIETVAIKHGLARASPRLGLIATAALADAVVVHLKRTGDVAVSSLVWAAIRLSIEASPQPFADALGISVIASPKPMKTMAAVFTGTGKGPKKAANHKEFDRHENGQTVPLCTVATKRASFSAFQSVATPIANLCALQLPRLDVGLGMARSDVAKSTVHRVLNG